MITRVNPLAESVDTDDDNSKETQTSITGDMTESMQLELQTLRTENLQLRSQVDVACQMGPGKFQNTMMKKCYSLLICQTGRHL